MRVIVTGGSGVLGSALVHALVNRGWEVIAVSRNEHPNRQIQHRHATYLRGDISEKGIWEKLENLNGKIDVLFHLAAHKRLYAPLDVLTQANVTGMERAIQYFRKLDIPRMVFASSTAVTGCVALKDVPAAEDLPPRPLTPYGKSKWLAEQKILALPKDEQARVVILRFGTVYGDQPGFLIPALSETIRRKSPMLRLLDVFAHHLFHPIFLSDAVDGLLSTLTQRVEGGTYFIVGPEAVPIGDLFQVVARALGDDRFEVGKKSAVTPFKSLLLNLRRSLKRYLHQEDFSSFLSLGKGKRIHRAYSLKRANELLGYFPKVHVRDGIQRSLSG